MVFPDILGGAVGGGVAAAVARKVAPEPTIEDVLARVDALNEHQSMLSRTLEHVLAGVKWRENWHDYIIILNPSVTGTNRRRFDVRKMTGGVPCSSVQVVRTGGATFDMRINGEQHPALVAAVTLDAITDDTIEVIEVNVTTGAANDDVALVLRLGAYIGPGA